MATQELRAQLYLGPLASVNFPFFGSLNFFHVFDAFQNLSHIHNNQLRFPDVLRARISRLNVENFHIRLPVPRH